MVCWNGFTQLLEGPCSRGRGCHMHMEESAVGVCNDHEHIEETKSHCNCHTKVAGYDRLRMVAHKRCPALGWQARAWPSLQRAGHILSHGARRHPQTELEQQFVGNALLSPCRVFQSHAPNQRLDVLRQRGATGLGFPAPKQAEALTMPARKRLRFHD